MCINMSTKKLKLLLPNNHHYNLCLFFSVIIFFLVNDCYKLHISCVELNKIEIFIVFFIIE